MNLKEFAALKTGDKIENPMSGSSGEICNVTTGGVSVKWGSSGMPYFYSVNTTAWMNWVKAKPTEEVI